MAFALDKRLEGDSHLAVTHKHIQIRLADDARYFWVILVPAITGDQNSTFVSEIHDLPAPVAADLWSLSSQISKWLQAIQMRTKSISRHWAMLSANFHLHVVARHRSDPAWPAPIWGHGTMEPLEQTERDRRLTALQLWYKQSSGMI